MVNGWVTFQALDFHCDNPSNHNGGIQVNKPCGPMNLSSGEEIGVNQLFVFNFEKWQIPLILIMYVFGLH